LLYDPSDLAIQEYFIHNAKPEGKCYESILSLLRIVPQGLYDLMRATGYTQSVVQNVLTDLEEQRLVERNLKERTCTAVPRLVQLVFSA
jgi:DNA-binding IclR family transcriptional regulator